MIDPTDDTYAEQQFQDEEDAFGSRGVWSDVVALCLLLALICAFVFKAAVTWLLFAAAAALAYGVVTGRVAPAKLWKIVKELPGQLDRFRQRLHVKVVVKMLPEDVTDAEDLKGRLFHSPPTNTDHMSYRDTFCVLVMKDRTQAEDYVLAELLRGLKAYHEDPIRVMAGSLLRRKTAPSTKPVAAQPQVQGFAALPIPGLNWLTQALAVALVLVGLWGVWGWKSSDHNDKRADKAEAEAEQAWGVAEGNKDAALKERDARLTGEAKAREDAERASQLRTGAEKRLAAARQKERRYVEEITDAARGGPAPDWDSRVRDLRAPQAFAGPDFNGGAASAPGAPGEVPDAAPAAPRNPDADPAAPRTGS